MAAQEWSSIELSPAKESPPVSTETLLQLENLVAAHIAQALPITTSARAPLPQENAAESQGIPSSIPADLKLAAASGEMVVRMVTMEGFEPNVCCGTHITNTVQLNSLVIHPAVQKVRGSNFRIQFAAGDRVRSLMRQVQGREMQLSAALSCSPLDLVDRVDKLLVGAKSDKKLFKLLQEELITHLVHTVVHTVEALPIPAWVHYHREVPSTVDLLTNMATQLKLNHPGVKVVLSSQAVDGMLYVLLGPMEDLQGMISQVMSAIPGIKGGGGKGKPGTMGVWQGRTAGPSSSHGLESLRLHPVLITP
jgi:misacylated tRNA(Ala) deacylase